MLRDVKELIKVHHGAMVDKGFYDCVDCEKGKIFIHGDTQMGEPDIMSERDCTTCGGTAINPNINIGQSIMLIVTELSEAVESDRVRNFCDFNGASYLNLDNMYPPSHKNSYFNSYEIYKEMFEKYVKDTFEDEFADTTLRIFDLCGYLEIVPNEVRGVVNWRTDNVADRIRQISKKVLDLNPDYIDLDFKTGLGFVLLYINNFCELHNIDLEKHRDAKINYNLTREHKHGKDY
jgi:hypothetical protein